MRTSKFLRVILPLLLLTALGFLAMGYHPGVEDDSLYLAAVKADVHPALFPHDADFFKLQMRTSVFDTWMAHFISATGMTVAWAELLWQLICIFIVIWSCWSIVGRLFEESSARWAGVAMVAAMLTLPVAGTGLYLMDQYLHPRNPATALILFAVARIMAGKRWQAVPLLAVAFLLHPLMGAMGISFCCVLALTLCEPLRARLRALLWRRTGAASVAAFIPFRMGLRQTLRALAGSGANPAYVSPLRMVLVRMAGGHWAAAAVLAGGPRGPQAGRNQSQPLCDGGSHL